jgi:transposase
MPEGFWLSDTQWERLAPLLPNKPRGVARVDDRRVISGIVVALQSGGRWIDVPAEYGPRKTLYNRFVRWSAKGVWQQVFDSNRPSWAVRLSGTVYCIHGGVHR